MSTADVERLLEQLIRLAPDPSTRRKAIKMRARVGALTMTEVLDRVPGETVIDKATYLQVARQTVYAWMDGTMRPNRKRAKQIAKVTGLSVAAIRGDAA